MSEEASAGTPNAAQLLAERDEALAKLAKAQEDAQLANARAQRSGALPQAQAIPAAAQPQIIYTTMPMPTYRVHRPLTGDQAKFNMSNEEVELFSYRWTVKALACIDIFFTLL